jgi:3-oxoadipate enol-lactonase
MKQLFLMLALSAAAGSASAQGGPGPIFLRVEGMDSVKFSQDRIYRTIDGVDLQYDLYLPAGQSPSSGWPIAVLFHGGPIDSKVRPKDWPLYQSYGRVLAASGIAAAIPNYRFSSPVAWQAATDDADQLIKHLRANASDLDIDFDAMALWAFSGGGPQLGVAIRGQFPYVRCLVSFYAFLDTLPEAAEYSPLRMLREDVGQLPPMFIARVGKDRVELNLGVDAFVNEARKTGLAVQVAEYADGVHAFDVEQDTNESRKIIAEAVGFVKKHLAPTDTRSGFFNSDGANLYYEVRGVGPVIVFLHDGLLHRRCWDDQWDHFAGNHTLVRYDRRGYGRSSAADKPYSDLDDLRGLLTHLGIERATIVGASAGGSLAIEYVLACPDAVGRLMLVGPIVNGLEFSEHFNGRNQAAFKPLAEQGNVEATIDVWANDLYLTAPTSRVAKRRMRAILEAYPQNIGPRAPQQGVSSIPAVKRLSEVKVPILVIVGESDIADVHAHAGAIQAGILGSKRIVVPGAGHLVYLEQPGEFNKLLAEFVSAQ